MEAAEAWGADEVGLRVVELRRAVGKREKRGGAEAVGGAPEALGAVEGADAGGVGGAVWGSAAARGGGGVLRAAVVAAALGVVDADGAVFEGVGEVHADAVLADHFPAAVLRNGFTTIHSLTEIIK